MQIGFGGVNVAPAAGSIVSAEAPRRVSGQQTERPVTETSESELRRRDEVEQADARDRKREASAADSNAGQPPGDAGTADQPGDRVDISV